MKVGGGARAARWDASRVAARDVISLYERHADAWVAARGAVPSLERRWLAAFVAALPAGGRRVLDLGCGTGAPMAAALVRARCRVTGIDGAASLVAEARRAMPDQDWRVADMRRLPPLGCFHGILAWHSFFHLRASDQHAMFRTFRRLAAPGATLMFTSGARAGTRIGRFAGAPLHHASLDARTYRALLHAHGFEVLRYAPRDPSCGFATVWLARRRGA